MEVYEHRFQYPSVREIPRFNLQPDHTPDTPPEPFEDYSIGIAEFAIDTRGI